MQAALPGGAATDGVPLRARQLGIELSGGGDILARTTRRTFSEMDIISAGADQDVDSFIIEKIFGAIIKSGSELTATAVARFVINELGLGAGAAIDAQGILRKYGSAMLAGEALLNVAATRGKPMMADMGAGAAIEAGVTMRRYTTLERLSGSTDTEIAAAMKYSGKADMQAGAWSEAKTRMRISSKADLQAGGATEETASVRYSANSNMAGAGHIYVDFDATSKEVMEAAITLQPGQTLVINTCDYTATLDGKNILEKVSSQFYDWIKLHPNSEFLVVDTNGNSMLDVKVDVVTRWV